MNSFPKIKINSVVKIDVSFKNDLWYDDGLRLVVDIHEDDEVLTLFPGFCDGVNKIHAAHVLVIETPETPEEKFEKYYDRIKLL